MKNKANVLFLLLSVIATSYASFQLHSLGVLPLKYEIPLIGVISVLLLLIFGIGLRLKNKYASYIMKGILVLLSGCLLFGGLYIKQSYEAFRKLTMPAGIIN